MEAIKKKFIKDKDNKNVAVEISIDEFNKIEQILEDYALGELIKETDGAENLSLQEAKTFYKSLKKQKMEISYNKKFLKQLAKIPEPYRSNIESFVFNKIQTFETPFHSERIQKLKGYDIFYKIRFGEYRVGLRIESNNLTFERALHRKEIYKYYP